MYVAPPYRFGEWCLIPVVSPKRIGVCLGGRIIKVMKLLFETSF